MTPLTMQQALDFQKQQALAQALTGNPAPMNQPNAGVANAGGNIASALMSQDLQKRMMAAQDPENQALQQRYGMTSRQVSNITNPSMMTRAGNWLSKNLFSLGGS